MRVNRDANKRRGNRSRAKKGENREPRCVQCGQEVSALESLLSPVCGSCVRENHRRAVGR